MLLFHLVQHLCLTDLDPDLVLLILCIARGGKGCSLSIPHALIRLSDARVEACRFTLVLHSLSD